MKPHNLIACLLALQCTLALGQPSGNAPPDAVLVRLGDTTVTEADFRAALERLPEAARKLADTSPERNRAVVENILVTRVLAERAQAEGLDRDPLTRQRLQLQQESFLASQYLAAKRRQAPLPPGLEDRARELFTVAPERYRLPERVHLQRILVDLYGRTREMALERALQVRARAEGGEEFLSLAKEYSDDPAKVRNRGDLGFITEKDLEPELWAEALKGLADGQVSEPIFTKAGYHLIKRIAYRSPIQPTFDDLKSMLVERELDRVRDEVANAPPSEILRSPAVQWNATAMDALTRQLSPEEIRRLSEETARRPQGPRPGR